MINALPAALCGAVEQVEGIIGSWPIKITIDHAIRWVLQFDSEDHGLALRVLRNIDVLSASDIRSALEVAHTKLVRRIAESATPVERDNTLFAAVGNSAKSGGLIAYYYRAAAGISEDDFISSDDEQQIDLSKIENIVLVDDIAGTGRTIAKEVKRVAEEVYSLSKSPKIFVLTVAGYEDGVKHVLKETGATVVCALEYNVNDTVTSLDADFYDGMLMEERMFTLNKIKSYCGSISAAELGYGDVGGLLVFEHNTPNTTLPIIWNNAKGWMPLFQRTRKIPGVAKIIKSAENERSRLAKNQAVDNRTLKRDEVELTLFVEGKIDEVFVDFLRQQLELAKLLGVKEVKAIALGGLYQSQRLLELLIETKKEAVFVLDGDQQARRVSARVQTLNEVRVLHLEPSFVALLSFDKLYANRDKFPALPERPEGAPDPNWFHDVEMAVLKRASVATNADRIIQIIGEYIDPEKYKQFAANLRKKVDELFQGAGQANH